MRGRVMQTEYSPADQAAQVITLPGRHDHKTELRPFNNSEHLQALEMEARLMVATAALRRGVSGRNEDGTVVASPFPLILEGADMAQAHEILENISATNRLREELSLMNGISLNFIAFCNSFKLDAIERKIVLLLLMQFSSIEFYATFEASGLERSCDNGMEIGSLLAVISAELGEQLAFRRYFSIYATLMENDILHSSMDHMGSNQSILKMSVYLQERYVRNIVGDNNQYHSAFRFIKIEKSPVRLEQVVLPEQQKLEVVSIVERFLENMKSNTSNDIDNYFGYGTGLSLLFYGPSGTGKTMLAKGLANHFSCPLVSLSLNDMSNIHMSDDEVLEMLFREAALTGGIVFLDECDDIFSERFNSRLSRALLMEIEKSRCITILATNKAIELDPALDRRISMKILFSPPDKELRLKIWQALIPPHITLAADADLEQLAERFQFSGGLIKNSILMAINAMDKAGDQGNQLTWDNLEHAANLQTATISDLDRICVIVKPEIQIMDLFCGETQKKELRGVITARDWLKSTNMGFNLLISTVDINSGFNAVSALAKEMGVALRIFNFEKVSSASQDEMLIDPSTQRKVSPMTLALSDPGAERSLTLFMDWFGDATKILNSEENIPCAKFIEMLDRLRVQRGFFCLVTREMKSRKIPAEFHHHLVLDFPSDVLQVTHWELNLPKAGISDDELAALVKKNPMHIAEIELMAMKAKVRALVHGRQEPRYQDLIDTVGEYRGRVAAPILFGGG